MQFERSRDCRNALLRQLRSVVLLTAMSAIRSDLSAQTRSVGAELWGHVLLAGDTIGVPGVLVEVMGLSASTTTSRTGFYRLASLKPGAQTLRVRRLGYQSVTIALALVEDQTLKQDIRLELLPTRLTEVRIQGQVRKVPPRFEDVYRRMSTANGSFFTREDIESLNPTDVQALLLRVGTVRISSAGIQFAKCNEGGNLVLSPQGGKVQIYIDGLRMTGRSAPIREKDPIAVEQREVLRMVNPTQIQAIEVYSGVSRIPGEFLEDACAVIAIWTRSY
jgi:hypothetical protein